MEALASRTGCDLVKDTSYWPRFDSISLRGSMLD